MRSISLRAVLLGALACPAGTPAWAAEPTLTRVTLSSGGVGQFVFKAEAEGRDVLSLDVPLDQVDDLLKSLRVDDPAGRPPMVRLPGRQPLSESFRTLPFGPAAFASPEALLAALVGEAVRIPASGVTGVILSMNAFDTTLPSNGGVVTRHRLAINTQAGLETLVLEDTPGLEFTNPVLRQQIGAALAAIAAQRVQDRRSLQLTLGEGGRRSVSFGYVVPSPVWKASYRLVVPAEGAAGPAQLQGFAVVENLSGRDWKDVEVVLTSGQPVLYHQPLYEAVFTARPEAPVEIPNRLTPAVDAGAVPADEAPRRGLVAPAPAPMQAPVLGAAMARSAPGSPVEASPPPPPPADVRQSVAQVEFRLAGGVTAASGETLLLPIVDAAIPARRVALYRAGQGPNPLVALLLTNDGKGALPPGLVTLFEAAGPAGAAFIGDARLPAIQPGEERLASFAADLPVRVETTNSADQLVVSGKAARGVLELVRRERAITRYRVTTPAGSGRTMLIEQPKRDGWALTELGPAAVGLTPTHYRITQAVPPGASQTMEVVLERPRGERIVLTDTATTRLIALAEEGRLSPELRAALTRAAALRTELDRRTTVLNELRARRDSIANDQARIRKNLESVPSNSDLQRRYLNQLRQQEDSLAALDTQQDAAQRALSEADASLKDYLGGLTL